LHRISTDDLLDIKYIGPEVGWASALEQL